MITETVMVYVDDLDAMGVVHNGRYAALLERALAAYWPGRAERTIPAPPFRLGALRGQGVRHHLSRADHPDRGRAGAAVARSPRQHQCHVRVPGPVR